MATEPTNPLVRIAQQDTILPATNGPNKIPPRTTITTIGWDDNSFVGAQTLNYTFDNIAEWVQYLTETVGELKSQIEKERVSVGEIIEIRGNNTNPAVLKGYGTWTSFGEGQVLVGVGSHTDDRGESKVWVDGDEEGEYKHVQTEAEMVEHGHSLSGTTDEDQHTHDVNSAAYNGGSTVENNKWAYGSGAAVASVAITTTSYSHEHSFTGTADNTGSSSPMNNIQPTLAVYRWVRVS